MILCHNSYVCLLTINASNSSKISFSEIKWIFILLYAVRRSPYQKEAEKTGPNIVHMHPLPRRGGQLQIAKSQTQRRDIRCAAAWVSYFLDFNVLIGCLLLCCNFSLLILMAYFLNWLKNLSILWYWKATTVLIRNYRYIIIARLNYSFVSTICCDS